MKTNILENAGADLATSLRIALVTLLLCSGIYPLIIFGFARVVVPDRLWAAG